MSSTEQVSRSGTARVISGLVRGVLPIVVIAGGVLGAVQLIKTAPQAEQRPRKSAATPVQTRRAAPTTEQAVVRAMGTVIAAQEIVIQPQVSGVIQELHACFVPGGRIAAGEKIASIDSADYEVAVRQAEATLARARSHLEYADSELRRVRDLEERQATNQKELDNARTAQASALADVAAAEAALERAKLDLSRTALYAPFDGVVVEKNVDKGSLVTTQTRLGTLVGTDEYWVRASIPVEQLRWFTIPSGVDAVGSTARITQRLGANETSEWTGRVVRLLGDLEPQGRMARVLLSVSNPLGESGGPADAAPLLIGSYVDVAIAGAEVRDVYSIGREELRDGETLWVMNDQGRLEIRRVEIIYRGRDNVLIRSGLSEGERLVVSDLPSPIAGMALREAGAEAAAAGAAASVAGSAGSAGESASAGGAP